MPEMSAPLRFAATFALLAVTTGAVAAPVAAENYPNRPVRLILPFPPGGPVDGMARGLGPKLSAAFRQPVVLDNRPGASGTIGIEAGLRSSPDGYTMLMVSSSYSASAVANQLPYHPVNDVTP